MIENVKFLKNISFVPCKSVFLTKFGSKELLPQYQEWQQLVEKYQCKDIGYHDDATHHTIKLVLNSCPMSIVELEQLLLRHSTRAEKFFYVAVNKFLVYRNNDTGLAHDTSDYDYELIQHCKNLLEQNFNLLHYSYRPDDHGQLGNFVYPVTTMFYQRNEQAPN